MLLMAFTPCRAAGDGDERSDDWVTIGAPLPLTGARAAGGAIAAKALEAAVSDFNAAGGILRRRIRLEIVDDKCDADAADAIAADLVTRRADVVIGHLCGSAGIAGARRYSPAGLLLISPGVRHARFTDGRPGTTIFRLTGRDDRQGYEAGRLLARSSTGRPITLVHDRTRWGRGLVDDARRGLSDAGVRAIAVETLIAGEKQYPSLAAKIAVSGSDQIFLALYPPEAAILLGDLKGAASKAEVWGSDVLADTSFAETAGRLADGVRVLMPGFWPDTTATRTLSERLAASGDASMTDPVALTAYAAAEIWRSAVESAGRFDASAVAAVLYDAQFETVLGPVRFDQKGDASVSSYRAMTWHAGGLVAAQ